MKLRANVKHSCRVVKGNFGKKIYENQKITGLPWPIFSFKLKAQIKDSLSPKRKRTGHWRIKEPPYFQGERIPPDFGQLRGGRSRDRGLGGLHLHPAAAAQVRLHRDSDDHHFRNRWDLPRMQNRQWWWRTGVACLLMETAVAGSIPDVDWDFFSISVFTQIFKLQLLLGRRAFLL